MDSLNINVLVNFITQHWVLSTVFVVLLLAFIVNEYVQRSSSIGSVTPQGVIQLINHHHAVVLDVRQDVPFAMGHIIGAIHVPYTALDTKVNTLKKYVNNSVVVVCATGQESVNVAQKLKTHGFEHLHVMRGGLNEWKQAGLPLVKS